MQSRNGNVLDAFVQMAMQLAYIASLELSVELMSQSRRVAFFMAVLVRAWFRPSQIFCYSSLLHVKLEDHALYSLAFCKAMNDGIHRR